jgi:hypothetical protein
VTWTTPIDPPADGTAITRAFYITYTKDNLAHLRTVTGGDPTASGQALVSTGAGTGAWTASPSITALTASGAITGGSLSISGTGTVSGSFTIGSITITQSGTALGIGANIWLADRFALNSNEYIQAPAANTFGVYVGNSPRYKQTASMATFLTTGEYTTSWTAISDRRSKSDVLPAIDALGRVMALQPITYVLSDEHERMFGSRDDRRRHGLIAQDVRDVVPDLVEENKDGWLSVDYSRLSVILVGAVQDLAARLDALEARA